MRYPRTLDDDLHYFPRYEAVYLYRLPLEQSAPGFVAAPNGLTGRIDEETMRGMNAEVKLHGVKEDVVAADFLGLRADADGHSGLWSRLLQRTVEQTKLVLVSLGLAVLLPIVRNTHAGLVGIAPELSESAAALGLPPGVRLRRVELPLATRSILVGIKTAAVINAGTATLATLAALIGAGGYGQPILSY